MKNTKRHIEPYSFYDHTGISAHLEKMAEKGWMIDKIANYGWIYRRIEPKTIHFAVSYYPKASEFDPEPSEEQKIFHDFCAHTGWELACTSAQMQIFYNECENPTPIETEPELELEAIHASAKKSFLPAYVVLLTISLLYGAMFVSSLLKDPIELLSGPTQLFAGFIFVVLAVLCTVELICYFRWHSKAGKAAEHGEFLKVPGTSKFQKGVLAAVFIGVVYWGINFILCGTNLQRWIGILMCIYMPALIVIVNATKEFLKRQKASRGLNRTVTMLTSFVLAFAMMGLITFATIKASSQGFFADKDEETYKHGGMTWVIHQDELPLTVEDLMDVDYDGYIRERRGDVSLLLGQLVMSQRPRLDADDYANIPQLEYTYVVVNIPALYDMCKERLIYEQEYLYPVRGRDYKPEEAAPWGANEVYRLYDSEFGASNDYLLCYDDVLVEISFDWEPTVEQRAIVGEKLGSKIYGIYSHFM